MEVIDNAKKLKIELDSLLKRASGSVLSRTFTFIFVASLMPTVYFSYVDYLQKVVNEQNKIKTKYLNLRQALTNFNLQL